MGARRATSSRLSLSAACALGAIANICLAVPASATDELAAQSPTVTTEAIAPNPMLTIDQNRATVVDRIMTSWGEALVASDAGLTTEQLQALLAGLRSDYLLAASLTGSLEGLRSVIANGLTATAPARASRAQAKALGDATDDLVYTPVTPCREVDTRSAGGQIPGGSSRDFKVWVSSGGFTAQGGSATNCNIPANPVAVVVNLTAVSPAGFGNFIAYPTGTPTSTSVLNYQSGQSALGNGAIVPVCQPNCTNQLTIAVNGAGADLVMAMTWPASCVAAVDGLLFGCGDAVIGVNPATDSVEVVGNILGTLDRLIGALRSPPRPAAWRISPPSLPVSTAARRLICCSSRSPAPKRPTRASESIWPCCARDAIACSSTTVAVMLPGSATRHVFRDGPGECSLRQALTTASISSRSRHGPTESPGRSTRFWSTAWSASSVRSILPTSARSSAPGSKITSWASYWDCPWGSTSATPTMQPRTRIRRTICCCSWRRLDATISWAFPAPTT